MTVVCIVMGCIILVLSFIVASVFIQLKDIGDQLEYISRNKTNKTVSIANASRPVLRLEKVINESLIGFRARELQIIKKDDEIKEAITNMSHDIRTPLTSLKGYFELLVDAEDTEQRIRYERIINERIASMGEILEELFIYTKVNSTAYRIRHEKTDISQVLIQTLISYYEDFEKVGITPRMSIEEGLIIIGDGQSLKRIFQNLIKNALIHGANEIEVTLKAVSGKKIRLNISNGYKTDERPDINRVFDRFYKGDSARGTNSSGIGLSVAKKLVQFMDGQISASVLEGKFTITMELPQY